MNDSLWTFSNGLSALRIPLALVFLFHSPLARCSAVVLAMVTDILDGYLARRYQNVSSFGAVLDPLTDKFFAFVALAVLLLEGRITNIEMAALLSRDFAIMLFGCYLWLSGRLSRVRFQALWCGKVTTSLQFFALIALNMGYVIPVAFYGIFVALGVFALIELYNVKQRG